MKQPSEAEIKKAREKIVIGQKIFNPEFYSVILSGYDNTKVCDEADKILKELDDVVFGKNIAPCTMAVSYLLAHIVSLSSDKWNKILDRPIKERIENYIG